jgi:multicomponent Na+:H+ antiporter subunit G
METILEIITIAAILLGTFFSALGLLGYLRLPDVYTRLHATGKVGVYGLVFLLVAAIAWTPLSFWKGIVIIGLLLISGPVVAHALASAAYRLRIPMQAAARDDLSDSDSHPVAGHKMTGQPGG